VRLAWLARLLGTGLALYLRLVVRTCRVIGPATRDQVVLAAWHEFNMLTFIVCRKRRADLPHASFSTIGFRGVVITAMLEHSGTRVEVFTLPPPEDRAAGRAFALRMARTAESGASLIVTPDGPFGPYRVAKPGVLIVARESGIPIQPWAVAIRPAIRLKGRWDRHLVPLPFCRMRVDEGQQIRIAPREALKPRLAELQAALDGVQALADRRMAALRGRTIGAS